MIRILKAASIVALVAALSGCLFPPPGAVVVAGAAAAVLTVDLWVRAVNHR